MTLDKPVSNAMPIIIEQEYMAPNRKEDSGGRNLKVTVADHMREYAGVRRSLTTLQAQIIAEGAPFVIDTLDRLFAKWLDHAEVTGEQSDIRTVKSHWNKHIQPFFGEKMLTEISFWDIKEFYVALLKTRLKERSVKNIMITLKRLIFLSFNLGLIEKLPAFIKIDTKLPNFRDVMNQVETKAFLRAVDSLTDDHHRLGLIYAMTLMALREGEALNMRFENIRGNNYVVVDGKSKYPRTVYMPESVRTHLFANGFKRHGLMFPSSRSLTGIESPHSSQYSMDVVKEAGKLVGKPNVTHHDLRATCASNLAATGMPMRDLSSFLGHTSTTTTEMYVFALNRSVEIHHKNFLAILGEE